MNEQTLRQRHKASTKANFGYHVPMPVELNPGVLWQLGYRNMTKKQVATALQEIYETLELAVGKRLSAALNRAQQREFERLIDEGHEQGAVAWLEKTLPFYPTIVQDEYDKLLARLEGALRVARRSNLAPGDGGNHE